MVPGEGDGITTLIPVVSIFLLILCRGQVLKGVRRSIMQKVKILRWFQSGGSLWCSLLQAHLTQEARLTWLSACSVNYAGKFYISLYPVFFFTDFILLSAHRPEEAVALILNPAEHMITFLTNNPLYCLRLLHVARVISPNIPFLDFLISHLLIFILLFYSQNLITHDFSYLWTSSPISYPYILP